MKLKISLWRKETAQVLFFLNYYCCMTLFFFLFISVLSQPHPAFFSDVRHGRGLKYNAGQEKQTFAAGFRGKHSIQSSSRVSLQSGATASTCVKKKKSYNFQHSCSGLFIELAS